MSEEEILQKYGSIKLMFHKCDGRLFCYKNKKYKVCGRAIGRCELVKVMTILDLWQELEPFSFWKI